MLNSKYVLLSSLGCYFVNKDDGLPLTEGRCYFYSDTNRSDLKPIYKLSGAAPDYSYTQLSNPITLSGTGTFIDDSGNEIIPYGYPYDEEGRVENYFIQIYSTVEGVDDVLQWTIEAYPNISSDGGTIDITALKNFIPNGQFLTHTDIPADELNDIPAGQITQPVTEIAYGNWTFLRPPSSTATDNVTFFRYGEYVANPTATPRYAVQIECLGADPSDAYKFLQVSFEDVNKFASDTEQYTFGFNANTFSSSDFTVGVYLIKNFGTGGAPSPTEVTQLTTFTITATSQIFQLSFVFGANEGKEVGTNNDDYVALAIGFPTNLSSGSQLTNFMLVRGAETLTSFPVTTDKDFDVRTVSPATPEYDGSSLYLPVILTKNGLAYDQSDIGRVYATLKDFSGGSLSTDSNEMLGDGAQYLVAGYSPLGIPFRRLWSRALFSPTLIQPIFGSGANFVSTYITGGIGVAPTMFLIANSPGSPSPPTDGAIPTGITFFNVFSGNSPGYNVDAYVAGSSYFMMRATTAGWVAPVTGHADYYGNGDPYYAGTSTFFFTVNRNTNLNYATNAPATKMVLNGTVAAASGLAGKYWQFNSLPGPTLHYMWFTVDGAGANPSPGGTAIQVNLKSTFVTATDMPQVVASALSGQLVYYLTFPAAAAMTAGSYWTFQSANGDTYCVYYTIDNVGAKPAVSAVLFIQVVLSSSDTDALVAQKTMTAINSTYYAAPNFQGMFLRGYDPSEMWDLSAGNRFGVCPTVSGNMLGTYELDQLLAHEHTIPDEASSSPPGRLGVDHGAVVLPYWATANAGTSPNYGQLYTDNSGAYGTKFSTETSAVNAYVNWIIKF